MDATEFPNLAKAVNRWLSYQLLCGRGALLSEAYLGHPMAEFLIHRHSGQFETEEDHPVLNSPGPGRPRQIDYVLLTRDAGDLEIAIECKWVSERPYDKQRIVNDILRLECVRIAGRHVKRYFLVAGLRDDFESNFAALNINTGRARVAFTKHFLSLSMKHPDRTVEARDGPVHFRKFYDAFASDFNSEVPKALKTSLVGKRTADDITVCVWQISSHPNRAPFVPSEQWADD